ncbi:TPA: fimbrial biogenesis outer membrane usher protein [Klebsiella quasipneumoniae subsp. similipneumoniae]|nr:fimbrial biogenesis outer membrane usher protein [Klebsiella quasipneumoniae subsp. similipneumoniae]HCI6410277.1 fimbrial biogenesis outer membrane usher protein [Klebsiella quasipneumoniae subsp. similipneumoniae]HCI6655408.1 fimbrial biogenesis outer membrane usher protein [Klebsiella quasipneumoniae subsp. similipneumoniae]HCI6805451.1 fimbrial biogenesis outer membrane usher protein [Klebsiella quasipneumoniae subsp. similipneumoniae]
MNKNPTFKNKIFTIFIITTQGALSFTLEASEVDQHNVSHTVDKVMFDPALLSLGLTDKITLQKFENSNFILPGEYNLDVFVNDHVIGREMVVVKSDDKGNAQFFLKRDTILKFNLNLKELPEEVTRKLESYRNEAINIKSVFNDASIDYDGGLQRLDVTLPQAFVKNFTDSDVPPELWDSGINALLVGYQGNIYTTRTHGKDYRSGYIGNNSGINIGLWQLRHNGNLNWSEDQGGHYQRLNTYVQRDLPAIKGRIIIGENNTSGQIFDSLPFRGVRIHDEERMLPRNNRGYAPEIRGIARTNAKVTIKQNGQIIRETSVTPGAFNIDDIYSIGVRGDLDVTITEADGTVQSYTVPYASVGNQLRPGLSRYEFVAGQYNDTRFSKKHNLYQASYQRGLSNLFTGYGGVQFDAEDYYSLIAGSAINTRYGALSFDVNHSYVKLNNIPDYDKTMSGQRYGVTYNKYFNHTKSNISVIANRYATSGYLDYNYAMQILNSGERYTQSKIYRPKNRLTATLNQSLSENYGQLYVSGFSQNYWNSDGHSDLQYQVGYSQSFHKISLSGNAGRTKNSRGHMEDTYMINISLPLSASNMNDSKTLYASFNRSGNGNYGQQVGVSGVTGKENQFSYGASAAHYGDGGGNSATVNSQYRSQLANLNASASAGKSYKSYSAGMNGTILAWKSGVTVTPYTGDSFAIVEAKGASGARVGQYSGVKIDRFGHAAVPYLNPYENNEISIDPKGTSKSVELESTTQRVAPYAGSIIKLEYTTQKGYPALVEINRSSTLRPPFGTEIIDEQGNYVGAFGQGNQAYIRVSKTKGTLFAHWGDNEEQRCQINYSLDEETIEKSDIDNIITTCSSES